MEASSQVALRKLLLQIATSYVDGTDLEDIPSRMQQVVSLMAKLHNNKLSWTAYAAELTEAALAGGPALFPYFTTIASPLQHETVAEGAQLRDLIVANSRARLLSLLEDTVTSPLQLAASQLPGAGGSGVQSAVSPALKHSSVQLEILGQWLSHLTLRQGEPLLQGAAAVSELLRKAYALGKLGMVLPCLRAALEHSADCTDLVDPWLQQLLRLLAELHAMQGFASDVYAEIYRVFGTYNLQFTDQRWVSHQSTGVQQAPRSVICPSNVLNAHKQSIWPPGQQLLWQTELTQHWQLWHGVQGVLLQQAAQLWSSVISLRFSSLLVAALMQAIQAAADAQKAAQASALDDIVIHVDVEGQVPGRLQVSVESKLDFLQNHWQWASAVL